MASSLAGLSIKVLVYFLLGKQVLWIQLLASISSFTFLNILISGMSFSVSTSTVLHLSAGYVALTDFCFFFSPGVLKSRCSETD